MGIINGALAGLGEGLQQTGKLYGEEATQDQRSKQAQDLAKLQADLGLQKAQALEQFKNELNNAPALRAGSLVKDAAAQEVPVTAAPVKNLDQSGAQAAGFDSGMQGNISDLRSQFNAVLANPTATDEQKQSAKEILTQIDNQAGAQQKLADDAVAGKTRKPTNSEVLQTAMQKALESGDAQVYAALKTIAGDKYVPIPDGGLLNSQTGEVVEPNSTKAQRQAEHDKRMADLKMALLQYRIDNGVEKLPAAAATAEWLVKNGVAKDQKDAWGMVRHVGDQQINEDIAQMIASGDASAGTVLGRLPSDQKLAILARAKQLNPDFRQTDYSSQEKAARDFATGMQGRAINSFNVGLEHLDQLGDLSDALKNGNMQAINLAGNKVSKWTGSAAPVNFDAAKQIVAAEIVKAITGSGGALADREEISKTINAANSPEQLKGVIDTMKGLMVGQLHGLQRQYESTLGKKDFYKRLTPAAQRLTGIAGPSSGAASNDMPDDIASILSKY